MPQKLLLADDSVTIQRVIELTFADEDVQVIAVGDGRQAIDRIAAEKPDIVLADIGMPGCDGYEVAGFVKHHPELSHIPVLLLTGAFEPIDEARAAAAGSNGVLAKPFEPQQLIARVRELLGGSSAVPVASAAPPDGADEDTAMLAAIGAGPGVAEQLGAAPPAESEHNTPAEDLDLMAASGTQPRDRSSLDDYFDRLDAAFANLAGQPIPDVPPTPPELLSSAPPVAEPLIPTTPVAAESAFTAGPPVFADLDAAPPMLPPAPAIQPPSLPPAPDVSVADAFGALLAAESGGAPAPRFGRIIMSAPAEPSEALVDQVCERVVARLGDQAVKATIADVVRTTTERLVREEIDRLKARIEAVGK